MGAPPRASGGLRRAAIRAAVLMGLAILTFIAGHRRLTASLGLVAIIQLVVIWLVPAVGVVLDRAIARLEALITLVILWAFWVFIALPVWAVQRVLRFDALGIGQAGFVPAAGVVVDRVRGSRSFSMEGKPTGRRRAHALAVELLALVLLVAAVAVVRNLGSSSSASSSHDVIGWCCYHDYAHEHEPFAQQLWLDQRDEKDHATEVTVVGTRSGSYNSRGFHVAHGIRQSYEPANPQITVWFFGGSTMFGIGQRDDHTLPSEIARDAERDGIRLKVVNYGTDGMVNYQEVELFGMLLSAGNRADLSVFYDGCNDGNMAGQRVQTGDPSLDEVRFFAPNLLATDPRGAFDGLPWTSYPPAEQDRIAIRAGAEQYRKGVDLARHLGQSYNVDTAFAWQPTMATKRQAPADAGIRKLLNWGSGYPGPTTLGWAIPAASGAHPLDLTKALNDVTVPLYTDTCHTNELGAHVIAQRFYQSLKPQLLALVQQPRLGH